MPEERVSARVTVTFYDDNWTRPEVGWDGFSKTPSTPTLFRHAARALEQAASMMERAPVVDVLRMEPREDGSPD
jgi:hypothetical protein